MPVKLKMQQPNERYQIADVQGSSGRVNAQVDGAGSVYMSLQRATEISRESDFRFVMIELVGQTPRSSS